MISLHVTIYDQGQGGQFKVMAAGFDDELVDVTDKYEVVAIQTDDGKKGFAVVKQTTLDEGTVRHPTGAEL